MIKITVPATSANLGPGFDCLGLALDLYNDFYIEEIEEGLVIEGCLEEFKNENNLFYVSFQKALSELNEAVKGIKIIFDSRIPLKGGLGSSATCIIGGILGAFAIKGIEIDNDRVLKIAKTIENHPDNIVPALLGGITVAVIENDKVYYEKFTTSDSFEFIALSPDIELSTEEARSILPKNISLSDGVYNVSRAALLAMALSKGNKENIRVACNDRFHQNYRGKLIPDFFEILEFAKDNGAITSFLSGAGPTIMIINEKDNSELHDKLKGFLNNCERKWKMSVLNLEVDGAKINNYK